MARYRFRLNVSGSYTANAVAFAGDGQCWLERDAGFTSAADGTQFLFSVWLDFTGRDAAQQQILIGNGSRVQIIKRTTNLIRVLVKNTANTTILQMDQNSGVVAALVAAGGWNHIAATSKNTAAGGFSQLYINGTSCATMTTTPPYDDTSFDFTDTDWGIGADVGGATNYLQADVAEFYWNDAASLDLSVAANLEKLRSASGHPVSLGSDGSTPTGATPRLYLKDADVSFPTNYGSGGNMVKKGTTALAAGGSTP